MSGWQRTIRCYVSPTPAGNNKIADWYEGLSIDEKAETDTFIAYMRKIRLWEWPQYRRKLKNTDGLGELRWYANRKQHRLIGFFKDGIWFAVMGCTHKQNIYNPPDALKQANKRKKQIEKGEVKTVEYDL